MVCLVQNKCNFKVGLTGGIACGKTTCANLFQSLGIEIIDADIIAREVVEKGQEALNKLVEVFSLKILNEDGSLNRKKLREIVFSDNEALAKLNSITHPIISKRLIEKLNNAKGPYAIAVVPLLFEHNLQHLFDRILVLDCTYETQVQRIMQRDGSSIEIAKSIIAKQVDRDTRLKFANDVILNNDILKDDLESQVQAMHELYLSMANNKS